MAHEIKGQRFLSRVEPAWHKLGRVFADDEVLSATDAAREVAGDVNIRKLPISVELPDGTMQKIDRYGVIVMPTSDDKVRDQYTYLGDAGKDWTPTSYVDLCAGLDPIAEKYKVETCGLLQDGARMFLALRGEDWAVLGKDEMKTYFSVCLSLKPKVGHKVRHTPMRVRCWNTEQASEQVATMQIALGHTGDAAGMIAAAAQMIVRFRETEDRTKAIFDTFAVTKCSAKDLDTIINAAFPEPKKPQLLRLFDKYTDEQLRVALSDVTPEVLEKFVTSQDAYEKRIAKSQEIRKGAIECYELAFQNEHPEMAGTLWAAYNAVTEMADWRGSRDVAESSLFGTRAQEKVRAFDAAMNLANINLN